MRVSQAFPSNYLKSEDLMGRDHTVTMSHVAMEDIGQSDHKPVLYFQGKQKGLVLNKTNANNIASQYGDETDMWAGRPITIFPSQTEYQGKTVPCIRIRLAGTMPTQQAPINNGPRDELGTLPGNNALDDDIPF